MATWEPHKVKIRPVNLAPVFTPPITKLPPKSECLWCGQEIEHTDGDGRRNFKVVWNAKGDYSCEKTPLGCVWDWNHHYHGYDGELGFKEEVPHNAREAAEWGVEWPDDEESRCVSGSHQTIEEVTHGIRRIINRPGDDMTEDIADKWQRYEELEGSGWQGEGHCEDASCGDEKCHMCNPDATCPRHTLCINKTFCDECKQPKHNMEIAWDAQGLEDDLDGSEPKSIYVPQKVSDANLLLNLYPESNILRARGYKEGYASGSVIEYIADTLEDQGWSSRYLQDFSELEHPKCMNSECSKFNVAE